MSSSDEVFQSSHLFWLSGDSPLSNRSYVTWFQACLAALSVPSHISVLTPHSVRRGAATELFAVGMTRERLAWWGGWTPNSTAIWRYVDQSLPASPAGLLIFQALLTTDLPVLSQESVVSGSQRQVRRCLM